MFAILILYLSLISCSDARKSINLETNRVHEWNETNTVPSQIERVNLRVTKTETSTPTHSLTVHIVRYRWTPPTYWNAAKNRSYDVICELLDHSAAHSFPIIELSVLDDINEIDERFSFPSSPVSLICAVRAKNVNGRGLWKYSPLVHINATSTESVDAFPQEEQEDEKEKDTSFENVKEVQNDHEKITMNPAHDPTEDATILTEEMSPGVAPPAPEQTFHNNFNLDQLLELIHSSKLIEIPSVPGSRNFSEDRRAPIMVTPRPIVDEFVPIKDHIHSSKNTEENHELEEKTTTTTVNNPTEPTAESLVFNESQESFDDSEEEESVEEVDNDAEDQSTEVISQRSVDADRLVSQTRSTWTDRDADNHTEAEAETSQKVKEDYDLLEEQIRNAIGADKSSLDRLENLFLFGEAHNRLL